MCCFRIQARSVLYVAATALLAVPFCLVGNAAAQSPFQPQIHQYFPPTPHPFFDGFRDPRQSFGPVVTSDPGRDIPGGGSDDQGGQDGQGGGGFGGPGDGMGGLIGPGFKFQGPGVFTGRPYQVEYTVIDGQPGILLRYSGLFSGKGYTAFVPRRSYP